MSNKEHFIQQAHHIIPVEALEGRERDIQRLFSLGNIKDFQQMGSNFIYLYSETEGKHELADRAKELLQENKNIFGDVPVGGVNHSGGHANYNNAVKEMLRGIFTKESDPDTQRMMILDLQRGLKQMLIEGKPASILQNTKDADVEKAILDEIKSRTYHPDTPNDVKNAREKSAQEYMNKFVDKDGKFIYDNNKFENRVFDGGTGDGNRSTNELAKYTAEKIYEPMRKLNEKIGFLSEQSIKKFSNYKETDPNKFQKIDDGTGGGNSESSRARQVIFSVTYDIERFMAGQNAIDDLELDSKTRENIKNFYKDFATSIEKLMTGGTTAGDIEKILTNLSSRAEDIKIAKILMEINNKKKPVINIDKDDIDNNNNNHGGKSKLAQVIDAIGTSGKFEDTKINGIKVSEYKKSAGSSGKPYVDLNTAIHQGATDKQFFNKLVSDAVQTRASGILDMASKVMNFQGFNAKGGSIGISSPEGFKSMLSDGTMEQLGIATRNADGKIEITPSVGERIAEALKNEITWDKSVAPSFVADGLEFVNAMYDSTIEGIRTGNWDNFKDKFGETAISFAIDMAVGVAVGVGLAVMATASVPAIALAGQVAMVAFVAYGIKMTIETAMELGDKIAETDFRQAWEDFKANHEIDDKFYDAYKAMEDYINDAFEWAKDFFNRTGEYRIYDPLVLDLNGNGIETIPLNGFKTLFDGDADGIATATNWVAGTDGILALDLNGNQLIDDGSELFGDSTKLLNGELAQHGYQALAEHDENKDGLIDENDSVFDSLKIWQDKNSDGISQSDEISTLSELGIESLSVAYTNENSNLRHATITQKGSFIKDGEEYLMADLSFAHNPLYSKHKDILELTEAQKQQPNVKGLGRLHDLRQASARSDELTELLNQYKLADTKTKQLALLPNIIEAWAKTDAKFMSESTQKLQFDKPHTQTTHTGTALTPSQKNILDGFKIPEEANAKLQALAGKVAILDSFTGQNTQTIYVASNQAIDNTLKSIERIYNNLETNLYNLLLGQTRLQPYLQDISMHLENGEIHIDYSTLNQKLIKKHAEDPQTAFIDLAELLVIVNPRGWDKGTALLRQFADEARLSGQLKEWLGSLHQNTIDKLATQKGSDDNDHLTAIGLLDKDVLDAGAGNDTLTAGKGISVLTGGTGNDIYQYHQGFGNSTIHNQDTSANRHDVIELRFANKADISYVRQGDSLVISIKGEKSTITVQDMFKGDKFTHHIDRIVLKDGEITLKDITTTLLAGTNKNDTIIGFGSDDVIHARFGDDIIEGRGGNDIIHSGLGNDRIDAGAGDDIIYLDMGKNYAYGGDDNDIIHSAILSNDTLEGGIGSDTYVFGRHFGKDEIINFNPNAQDKDTIKFTQGINLHHLNITRQDNDLIINQKHTANTLKITDFFDKDALGDWAVQEIVGSNGKSINTEQIKQLVTQGTYGNDTLYAYSAGSKLDGSIGHDTLIGNIGKDTLLGNVGNDVLIGGLGDDRLEGGHGNDTYIYKKGDGSDVIRDIGGRDTLKLEGLTLSDLGFERKSSDLNIIIKGTEDNINIQGYFNAPTLHPCFPYYLMPKEMGRIENIQIDNASLSFKDVYMLTLDSHHHNII